jgi:hypothetical protein
MDTGLRGNRVLWLVRAVALLVLLGGLVWLAVVLMTQGVQRAGSWASVLGVGAAITGAVVTLVTAWLQQRPAVSELATAEQVAQAVAELRTVVCEQWRREAEARSLGDPAPMPVRWRLAEPAVMDHDEHIMSGRLRFAGRSDRIEALTDQFRVLRRRRLVIIGAPGSGKTTLAVQLLLQLLADWQPEQPVPVLFSLASWDPSRQPRAQDWLADQLAQTYPHLRAFGPDVAQKLADQGRLLPVLDGLDEVVPQRRGEVVDRLNASLPADVGLIVTSRSSEYTDTVQVIDVFTAAAVIQPEPLTASEAVTYLQDRLPRRPPDSWQQVLTALKNGTAAALAEVVASPLGLWLLRTVYIEGRRDPQPLIDPGRYPNTAAIQHHLLDELIPATIRSRPPQPTSQAPLWPRGHYDPERVRRWLTTLAIELRQADTRDWRWWQLARHTFTPWQIGLIYGLVAALVLGLGGGLGYGLWGRLLGGLGAGLGIGLAFGLTGGRNAPVHFDLRLRGRATAFIRSVGLALYAGLLFGLIGGLQGGLVIGLGAGLIGGLAFGLIYFVPSPSVAQRVSSPAHSEQGDRRLTILAASVLGLIGALGGAFLDGLRGGLYGGLAFGPVIGITTSNTCWPTFVMASLYLQARRRFPFLLMRFLDDAYRLGLLRIVGPVYQFRHAALQDHLAPPAESAKAPTATDPSPPLRTR